MPYGTGKFDSIENSTGNSVDLTSMVSTEATSTDKGYMSAADKSKLDGVEVGATADQTGAEIKAAYENEADTNAFTDAEKTKLAGVEENATSDQTGAEIKAAYEAEADTNAYDDAAVAKLAGIEVGATADQTGAEIKSAYEAEADTNAYTDAEKTKLAGIATGAEVNVATDLSYTASTRELASSTGTNATLPEVVAAGDSGLMTGADKTKLDAIEAGATADQTGAEIKSAYEGEADTNAFTDAEKSKLAGIEAGATADQTVADLGLENVDNTSDANKPISTATQTALDAKADLVGGLLDTSQLPDIAISEYKGAVADQTAMLAITGEKGDWVIRNDDSKVYVITGTNPASASDWTALSYPAGFSGAYSDLSGKPTLGTAAATDSTAYATAAQGSTADSATQPGDNISTLTNDAGYITSAPGTNLGANYFSDSVTITSSTGSNVGVTAATTGQAGVMSNTDKSKLDGIAAGATNVTNNNQLTNGAGYTTHPNPAITSNGSTPSLNSGITAAEVRSLIGAGTSSFSGSYNDLSNKPTIPTNNNQLTNGAGYITSADGGNAATLDGIDSSQFIRSDVADVASQQVEFTANATNNWDSIATTSGSQGCIEIYNSGSGNDAFMSFHVGGDYACYFGLDGGTNKLSVGGWSMGANSYAIYHEGNKPSLAALGYTGATNANYITNNNQLTNGAGYITNSGGTTSASANTVAKRDGSADISCRLVRSNYQNQSTISGAIAFRVNTSDNYVRFCSSPSAVRTWIGAGTSNFSGSYNDLSNKPTIPTNNNQLTNGAGYITSADGGNAATLDSIDSSQFLRSDAADQKTSGNLRFNDNIKLTLGNSDDSQLYFDGSGQTILNQVTGNRIEFQWGGTWQFRFEINGSALAKNAWNTWSDISLKTNIEVIPDALNKVAAIRGVTYDRIDVPDSGRHTGVIAQEVEVVLPEVVNTSEGGIKSVSYGNLAGLLIEAVKELKSKNEALEARIEALENA